MAAVAFASLSSIADWGGSDSTGFKADLGVGLPNIRLIQVLSSSFVSSG
jgi:hypothetical protein